MTFTPIAPTTYVPPTKIAKDTFVIHQVQPALGQPLFVYLNSMVILGQEPMIVDTGTPANREQWLKDVFSLVEPNDVRWIFLSHDDVDHTGNLDAGDGRVPERAAGLQLGDDRAAHELLRLPARTLPMGHARRVARHRRPHVACAAPTGVRLADDARAVRPDHRRVLGGRHLRHTAPRPAHRRSPTSTRSSGTSGCTSSRSAPSARG